MDKLLPQLYGEYGKYINQFRSFPLVLDGAKLIERRLLMSLYQVAKEKYVKSAKVTGHCIAHYHPHGDTSAYSSLVGMVQNQFATGQGNWGTKVGIVPSPAAAARYTEVKLNKKVLENSFEYIKNVPYEELELDSEPIYIPSKFPLCLLYNNANCQGMGFGYSTMIPSYKESDLMERLKWILGGKKGKGPIIKPLSDCTLIATDADYESILTTGKGKIGLRGKIDVDGNKSIIIKSIPPIKTFQSVLGKFKKEFETDKSLGWHDESTTSTRVRFTIVKARMLKIAPLKARIQKALTSSLTFSCNMCDTNGKVVLVSIDQMLLNVYTAYKHSAMHSLTEELNKVNVYIEEMRLIQLIKPKLSDALKIHPDEIEKVIRHISDKLNVTQKVVKEICDKYTISKIFKVKDTSTALETLKLKLTSNLKTIDTFLWDQKYKGN